MLNKKKLSEWINLSITVHSELKGVSVGVGSAWSASLYLPQDIMVFLIRKGVVIQMKETHYFDYAKGADSVPVIVHSDNSLKHGLRIEFN
ncbi:MAG: hypothetical protein ACRCVX_14235 [Shewanella sp.]